MAAEMQPRKISTVIRASYLYPNALPETLGLWKKIEKSVTSSDT